MVPLIFKEAAVFAYVPFSFLELGKIQFFVLLSRYYRNDFSPSPPPRGGAPPSQRKPLYFPLCDPSER